MNWYLKVHEYGYYSGGKTNVKGITLIARQGYCYAGFEYSVRVVRLRCSKNISSITFDHITSIINHLNRKHCKVVRLGYNYGGTSDVTWMWNDNTLR